MLSRRAGRILRHISLKRSLAHQASESTSKPQVSLKLILCVINSLKFPVWKSFGLFLATGAGLLLYFRNEKQKQSLISN